MLWIRIPFMRIRIRLITLIRIRLWIRILFLFDADPDPTFHPDAAPDQDTSFIIWLKPSYSINFGSNCGFYLMWIQVYKMMAIVADPDPQHWQKLYTVHF